MGTPQKSGPQAQEKERVRERLQSQRDARSVPGHQGRPKVLAKMDGRAADASSGRRVTCSGGNELNCDVRPDLKVPHCLLSGDEGFSSKAIIVGLFQCPTVWLVRGRPFDFVWSQREDGSSSSTASRFSLEHHIVRVAVSDLPLMAALKKRGARTAHSLYALQQPTDDFS